MKQSCTNKMECGLQEVDPEAQGAPDSRSLARAQISNPESRIPNPASRYARASSRLLAMIELIGVPFDLTGKAEGSRLGPDALRLAGIRKTLEAIGEEVTDSGDLSKPCEETTDGGIRNFKPLLHCLTELKAK